jgi:hypothetical protein
MLTSVFEFTRLIALCSRVTYIIQPNVYLRQDRAIGEPAAVPSNNAMSSGQSLYAAPSRSANSEFPLEELTASNGIHIGQHFTREGPIKVYNSPNNKPRLAWVFPVPESTGNWISAKIVRLLHLTSYHEPDDLEIIFRGKRYEAQSRSVDLTCLAPIEGNCFCRHKFRVVENSGFDILLGCGNGSAPLPRGVF